jgi:hypothetical protein
LLDNYDFDENSENMILSSIVLRTFDGFEKLIDTRLNHNNFLDCISMILIKNTSSVNYRELFVKAVNEVLDHRNIVLDDINKIALSKLVTVGLTGNSLILKNQLFREKLYKLKQLIGKFADFTNNQLIEAFLQELDDLLNILESLKIAIPSLEPLVELIKALISLLKQIFNN